MLFFLGSCWLLEFNLRSHLLGITIALIWSFDVPMKGMLDQDKENPRNQEIKAISLLFKELRPVGEAVVQARMDPRKGHFG